MDRKTYFYLFTHSVNEMTPLANMNANKLLKVAGLLYDEKPDVPMLDLTVADLIAAVDTIENPGDFSPGEHGGSDQ